MDSLTLTKKPEKQKEETVSLTFDEIKKLKEIANGPTYPYTVSKCEVCYKYPYRSQDSYEAEIRYLKEMAEYYQRQVDRLKSGSGYYPWQISGERYSFLCQGSDL